MPKQKSKQHAKTEGNKITKNYNETQMTKRRSNTELIKKTAPCTKGENYNKTPSYTKFEKKYQWMDEKDHRTPKQRRQQHAEMKCKFTLTRKRYQNLNIMHPANSINEANPRRMTNETKAK